MCYYLVKIKDNSISILDSVEKFAQRSAMIKRNFDIENVTPASDKNTIKPEGRYGYKVNDCKYIISRFRRDRGYLWNSGLKEKILYYYQIVVYKGF